MDNIDNSVQKVIDLLERIPHNYAEITQRTHIIIWQQH